jgi:hypothetical protein
VEHGLVAHGLLELGLLEQRLLVVGPDDGRVDALGVMVELGLGRLTRSSRVSGEGGGGREAAVSFFREASSRPIEPA